MHFVYFIPSLAMLQVFLEKSEHFAPETQEKDQLQAGFPSQVSLETDCWQVSIAIQPSPFVTQPS